MRVEPTARRLPARAPRRPPYADALMQPPAEHERERPAATAAPTARGVGAQEVEDAA